MVWLHTVTITTDLQMKTNTYRSAAGTLLTLLLLISFRVYPQVPDDSRLVFDDTRVGRLDVTISPAALQWMYNNVNSDSEHVASIRFRNAVIDESYDSIGFRLRGATSRTAQKKSFKVDMNRFISGQKIHGLKNLNFNGEHNDISIMRSKLSMDIMNSVGLQASRAAYCEVYINGKYYGLYTNIEEPDELFLERRYKDPRGNLWKCIYPADLRYLGENPTSYTSILNNGTPAYDLKTNTDRPDFGGIIRLARMLNNTSNSVMRDSVDLFIDAPSVLKYTAMCVVTGSWDCYWSLMNNYFLYLDPATGRMMMHPYDFDNSFGVSWSTSDWATADIYNWPKFASGARPLVEKLLANSYYRNMYTHFISYFANNVFTLTKLNDRIDSLKALITPYAMADTFRTKDYGFTFTQFLNSFTTTPFVVQHIKNGLKQFITLRSSSINSQVNYQDSPPLLYALSYTPARPRPTDSIKVSIAAFSPTALAGLSIKVTPPGGSTVTYPFVMQRNYSSLVPEEYYKYVVVIPPQGSVPFQFSVEAKDVANKISNYPNTGKITVFPKGKYSPLFVNEICAANTTVPDPSGEYDDWMEIYNSADTAISLKGLFLSDDPATPKKWKFTQDTAVITPHSRMVLWCDEQRSQPGYHTNFKFSQSGEFISLYDSVTSAIVDSFTFGQQISGLSYGRIPDGGTNITFLQPTPGRSNIIAVTQVEERATATGTTLFPNPATNIINIKLNGVQLTSRSVVMYSVTGKEVLRTEIQAESTSLQIPVTQLAAGVYLIIIEGDAQPHKAVIMK